MGEHRFSFKMEFQMHGIEKKHECYLNWSDKFPQNMANAIEEWHEEAMTAYYAARYKEDTDREKREASEKEAAERAEYERLKAKFNPD